MNTQTQICIFFPRHCTSKFSSWVVALAFKCYTNWDNDEKDWQTWTCNFERRFRYRRVVYLNSLLGSLRSYDCNENVTLKLNFASSSVFCDYSMLVTLYKIGGVHFRLLGTIAFGFHVKAKNDRFTAASSRCRQSLKYDNFPSSFGRLRQKIAPKIVPRVKS